MHDMHDLIDDDDDACVSYLLMRTSFIALDRAKALFGNNVKNWGASCILCFDDLVPW